jgi:hypothetical protein
MKTANGKPWLSPHGQTLYMAEAVLEMYGRLKDTDEYRNHKTYQMWIAESQKIVDEHRKSMTSGSCMQ